LQIFSLITLLAMPSAGAERGPEDLGVIPAPQIVKWSDDTLLVDATTKIVLGEKSTAGAKFAADHLQHRLQEQTGLKLELAAAPKTVQAPQLIAIGNPKSDPRVAQLMKAYRLELTDAMTKEGYVLGIGPQGVVIGAESDRGLLYGTTTLRQM